MGHSLGRHSLYCLACHATIGEWHGASIRCPTCGAVNLRVDQDTYWTQTPSARRAEWLLKALGTAVIASLTISLMLVDAKPAGTGWKIFGLMGALIPAALWWDLASLRTRRQSRLRVEVFVPAMFLVLSVGPFLWSIFRALWGEPTNLLVGFMQSMGILLVVQPFVFASWLLVVTVDRMRKRVVAAESHRAAQSARSSVAARGRAARGAAPAESVAAVHAAIGLQRALPAASFHRVHAPGATSYCLHCFAPMAPIERASGRCEVCGNTTLRVDQRQFWTKHPRFLRMERVMKACGIGAAIALVYAIKGLRPEIAEDLDWFGPLGVPIVLVTSLMVWDLSGMLTRRRSMLRLEFLLPFIVGGFGIVAVFLGRAVLSIRGVVRSGPIHEALWLPWSSALPFLYASPVVWLLMRAFMSWRDDALESGLREGRERMVASME